jgi:magnesium and cobalt transporter
MSDSTEDKSWLKRLSHALLREPHDRRELIEILQDAKEHELLDSDAFKMIEGVLRVSEMKVRDVMIPRPQMVVVEEEQTPEQALPIIIQSAHSRYPVIGSSRDEVIGILLAKDILPFIFAHEPKKITMHSLVRPATFIPESKRLDVLLKEFRLNRNHMAIVVDEYGGVAGLVTIEDVLEQIVGNIEDEYDILEEQNFIQKVTDNEFTVKALTPIETFNNYFGTNFSTEDWDTVGGLILQKFSHLPKRGETTKLDDFNVTVLQTTSRGIKLLKFKKV